MWTLGTALLLASCSGPSRTTGAPALPDRFPNHSTDQIRTQILGASDTIQSYSAKARVAVQSPDQDRSFNAVVHHRRGGSLFMRVSLFGVEGGRLLVTRDSVFFYDTRNSVLRVGPVEDVQQLFPAPVSSDDFFQNMLGLLAPTRTADGSPQADSSLYYVSDATDQEQYTVDPTRWRVVRYEERSESGTIVQKRVFSDFRPVEGVLLPAQVMFQQPAADLQARVEYQEMTLNPSDLSFSLDVPSQVPRRPFR
jgi:outer membrane lipoprotein-sorting protein